MMILKTSLKPNFLQHIYKEEVPQRSKIMSKQKWQKLDRDYIDSINQERIILVIMGKDPFPTKATNIPFCKKTWAEQLLSRQASTDG